MGGRERAYTRGCLEVGGEREKRKGTWRNDREEGDSFKGRWNVTKNPPANFCESTPKTPDEMMIESCVNLGFLRGKAEGKG